jgi:hypothetical protein
MPLPIGATLQNRYTIERVLGQGGMGTVYLARHGALGGKAVAVKELAFSHDDPAEYARAVKQFNHEAELLAHLDHPCLITVSDFFQEADHHYLVMSYVDGRTLEDVLAAATAPLGVAQVLDWMEPVCAVLAYLHRHEPPIIYRDLKPSNIMLDTQGRIRLLDFGIARVAEPDRSTSTVIKGMGSIGYSPPEQFSNAHTDARSDIYALAATIYHLVTGTVLPFSIDVMLGVEKLVPPRELNATIPPELDKLLLNMLASRPESRPRSIDEVRTALGTIRADLASQDTGAARTVAGIKAAPGDTVRPAVATPPLRLKEQKGVVAPWIAAAPAAPASPPRPAAPVSPPRPAAPSSIPTPAPDLRHPGHLPDDAAPAPAWTLASASVPSADAIVYHKTRFSLSRWYAQRSWLMALIFTLLGAVASLPFWLHAATQGPLQWPHIMLYRLGTLFFMSSHDPKTIAAGGVSFVLGVPTVLAVLLLLLRRPVGCAFTVYWLSQVLLEGGVYLSYRSPDPAAQAMRAGWETLASRQGYSAEAACAALHQTGIGVMAAAFLGLAVLLALGAPTRRHDDVSFSER